MSEDLAIKDGSNIAVIGGGPAGSFFAHFAQKWSLEKEIDTSISIFDGKDFLQSGPTGCNLCAGVIAESLNQKLKDEGIFLPDKRIVNRIEGYCLHVDNEQLLLTCTENDKNAIATVFRGNGPRYFTYPENISFDDFLLSWAQDRGAKVISQPVWEIKLPEDKTKPIILYFGKRNQLQKFEADLVVGAFGVNTYLMKKIQKLGFGYIPPSTLTTFQAELKLGREEIFRHFGNNIHVYMPKSKTIRYATVIPKGDYLTITLIGKRNAKKEMFQEFLSLEETKNKIPRLQPHCFCYPRIVVSPSKKPYSHRLVIIGDASFSRHYKNGIESAFITAQLAAEAAFCSGIDASSFTSFYYKQAKKMIIHDNYYGQFLFLINDIISSVPLLTHSHLSLAKQRDKRNSSKKIRSILWNMFTGNIPYRDIFKISLDLKLQISLLLNTIMLILKKIKKSGINLYRTSSALTILGPLNDKDVVVIIGAGPAGSSCAIKLKKLALQRKIAPRIIIYEGKRFEKKSYYNQCLGVLSPPLGKIMEEELGIPFPWEIIQKRINGYFIYSDNNNIRLSGEHEPSYACRRVEFDNYLFQKVKEMGIEIIPARVTDLDFGPDGVMVYSESNNIKANVVVGAFGLDDGMAKTFERLTPYCQPRFLSSIVTKIHPGTKAMAQFGEYLHAFLLSSLPYVEFGAITPKGNHLSLNIVGKKVDATMMDKFLCLPSVRRVLPDNINNLSPHLYYFKGKFPTLPAKGLFGNRYVMIGDASGLNRPFKGKGINSSVITGIRAAEAIISHGISKEAFQKYIKSCSELTDDIPYGKIFRYVILQASRYRLLDSIFDIAKKEAALRRAFFNIVSGQETYKKTWQETKNIKLLFRAVLKLTLSKFMKKKIM
ncbi:MAG: NAD(P)/FAD-dependent oxidoreductase [Candidatus Aminicenantaceae bacterium]